MRKLYGSGNVLQKVDRQGRVQVRVPALSAVVYRSTSTIPRSARAPRITLAKPVPSSVSHGRMRVQASVGGSSFREVTFQSRVGSGSWRTIGVDDTAPYRVFHDTSSLRPGQRISYRAGVLDNAGHTRGSQTRATRVPSPQITINAPANGSTVANIDPVTVSATVDPERATQSVRFERSVAGGAWTSLGTDTSSPAYVVHDDVTALPLGTSVRYRATLSEGSLPKVISKPTTVTTAAPQPARDSVTLVGSLQSELGCTGDWAPACAATHLTFDTTDGKWHGTFALPEGDFNWKVAINDSWAEDYGAGGARGGSDMPLSVPVGGASYVFTWDQVTHVPTVAPAP